MVSTPIFIFYSKGNLKKNRDYVYKGYIILVLQNIGIKRVNQTIRLGIEKSEIFNK